MPNSDSRTDDLVQQAGAGDGSAMRTLFDRHRNRLERMLDVRMDPRVRGRIDPSDVIQETLLAASKRMQKYASHLPVAFYPWLRSIAFEKLLREHERHLHAAKRSVSREQLPRFSISDQSAMQLAERFTSRGCSPSSAAIQQELRTRVREALEQLPETDRELLLLRYLEQSPSHEIAAILRTSEAAVNMRHMRAIERMRTILSQDFRET